MPTDLEEMLQGGLEHHQAGRLTEAAAAYRAVIEENPAHGDALHLLAIIYHHAGRHDEALTLLGRAIAAAPGAADFYNTRGEIHRAIGNLDAAVDDYATAIAANPDFVGAYNNLGVALYNAGRLEGAERAFTDALRVDDSFAAAHNGLGAVLRKLHQPGEAIPHLERAVELAPDDVQALNNLGVALKETGRAEEALDVYRRALAVHDDHAEAHYNLGNALQSLGQPGRAAESYRRAIAIRPDYLGAHNNLGVALQRLGRLTEAAASFDAVLQVAPEATEALGNLGETRKDMGLLDEARGFFERALEIDPGDAKIHSNLILALNYCPDVDQEAIYQESRRWAARHVFAPMAAVRDLDPERRLKIGYISPDFRDHSVSFFFEPLLERHDPKVVEIHCYANVLQRDEVTQRLIDSADDWHDIADLDDEGAAALIDDNGIDILVDLAGHTAGNRLLVLARRPAPIQLTWLGYPNTTGLEAVDYRLVDADTDPPGDLSGDTGHQSSERLVRLPAGFLALAPPAAIPIRDRASDGVTFGCLNNIAKVTPEVVTTWTNILARVPASRLLLKSRQLGDDAVKARYRTLFADAGIAPDRVEFHGHIPERATHLDFYNRIDVALDTFPYNGTTTTIEALWMGVPVITLLGTRHGARVGASLLRRIGLDELIANDLERYVNAAVALAADGSRRHELRHSLRRRLEGSPLLEPDRLARELENVYRTIWRRHVEGANEET